MGNFRQLARVPVAAGDTPDRLRCFRGQRAAAGGEGSSGTRVVPSGRARIGGQGVRGGPQLGHDRGRLGAVAHDVADDPKQYWGLVGVGRRDG